MQLIYQYPVYLDVLLAFGLIFLISFLYVCNWFNSILGSFFFLLCLVLLCFCFCFLNNVFICMLYLYAKFVLLVLFHCIVECGCIVIINELLSVHDSN